MTKALTAAAIILMLAPSVAFAQHRASDAALGAVSGAVVLGPIGAVAGAFIGYSAGPAIARSWGIERSGPPRQRRQASKERVRGARAEAVGSAGTRPAAARVEKDARVATTRNEASNAAPSARPSAPSATTSAPAATTAAPVATTPPPVQTLE
ncbi:hypothetical protein [Bradyrhizobium sp. AUGA SZCCT0160]|uniref:hypothetical protein n=1 Tax=Bradyrhizobium sp. AUGA SZCCT0160 TaxID=2807662 RepID=UPI001BA65DA0|nr:hypothetical protein [Bradyrhizobium sp. AUGA SZCCT0160]MBR1192505.1 hypothetical protein [Bradyrhizobium sp. AUGA SZCCT0160]